jgi:hypothetical protein
MKSLVVRWLHWRMGRVLEALNDALSARDHCIFCHDMEACDVVDTRIKKLKRKALRLSAAITIINRNRRRTAA